MPTLKANSNGRYFWEYVPSRIAAIVFVVLYILGTGFVFWRIFRDRSYYSIPFAIGGIFEVIGYIARALAYDKTNELGPFLTQSLFLLLAPALYAASVYTILGRIIRASGGSELALISPRWITRIFVSGDVVSFLVQCLGGGLMASPKVRPNVSQNIILGGLAIQIILFGFFVILSITFQLRRRRSNSSKPGESTDWEKPMWLLYAVSALIMVRSVYRVIEYALGSDGYLLQHEWPLYVFDGGPMLIALACYGIWHPKPATLEGGNARSASLELIHGEH